MPGFRTNREQTEDLVDLVVRLIVEDLVQEVDPGTLEVDREVFVVNLETLGLHEVHLGIQIDPPVLIEVATQNRDHTLDLGQVVTTGMNIIYPKIQIWLILMKLDKRC